MRDYNKLKHLVLDEINMHINTKVKFENKVKVIIFISRSVIDSPEEIESKFHSNFSTDKSRIINAYVLSYAVENYFQWVYL